MNLGDTIRPTKTPPDPESHFQPRVRLDRLLGRSRLPAPATRQKWNYEACQHKSSGPGPTFHCMPASLCASCHAWAWAVA